MQTLVIAKKTEQVQPEIPEINVANGFHVSPGHQNNGEEKRAGKKVV